MPTGQSSELLLAVSKGVCLDKCGCGHEGVLDEVSLYAKGQVCVGGVA